MRNVDDVKGRLANAIRRGFLALGFALGFIAGATVSKGAGNALLSGVTGFATGGAFAWLARPRAPASEKGSPDSRDPDGPSFAVMLYVVSLALLWLSSGVVVGGCIGIGARTWLALHGERGASVKTTPLPVARDVTRVEVGFQAADGTLCSTIQSSTLGASEEQSWKMSGRLVQGMCVTTQHPRCGELLVVLAGARDISGPAFLARALKNLCSP